MRHLSKRWFICLFVCLIFASCSDVLTSNKQSKNNKKVELQTSQQELKAKLKASALLMQEVVTQPKARKELRYAIDYYSNAKVIDERVYLGAMFDTKAAYRKSLAKKKGSGFLNAFAKAFKNSSIQGKAKVSNNYSPEELIEFLKQENIALYFPYHKKWEGKNITPSLTYHPLDNEYVSQGWKPVISKSKMKSSSTQEWQQVTMTDEYAMSNPTMVVVPCEEGPYTDPCYGSNYESEIILPGGGGGGGGTGGGDDSPPACIDGEPCGHKIQYGWMKLTHDYDGWLAGGSEIKFISVDAVKSFASDDNPTLEKVYVSQHFSRGEINDGTWTWSGAQFDQDWEEYELAKELKIYEADGNGLDSIKLSAKVEVGPVTITPSLTFDLSNDRADIFRTFYQRDQFFANNDNDFGNGTRYGEQIRSVGGVSWTMTITPYAY